ncbi:MAG: MFS transporter [Anaerovoracaceae bacterium]
MSKSKLFSKNFTLVVIGQIISLFGNAILRFALPLYLLKETGSPALFGFVTACSFLPMIVLSLVGGVLADRVNKRNIMVILDFLTGIIITIFFFALGEFPVVPLITITLMLLYGISGTYQPTVQASIPVLVSKEHILSAGAVVNQIGSLAGLSGPIIGGILFGAFGLTPILIISIICFLLAAIMEIFICIPFTPRMSDMDMFTIIKEDLRDSIQYMKDENPVLLKIIAIVALFNLLISSLLIIGMPVLIINTLKMSDEMLGFAQGALALGGLGGGICTAVFSKKLKVANAHMLLFFCSLSIVVMAIPLLLHMPNMICYVVLTLASFMIMAFATIFSVQMLALVQTQTPEILVGKIMALMMSLVMISQPIGQAIYGVIFDCFDNSAGMIALVVACFSCIIFSRTKKLFVKIGS